MPVPLPYPVLMPETPPEIITEIGKSRALRRLKEELITGARFQQEYMILRQQRLNEANQILEARRLEGIGDLVCEVDPEFHAQMILQYGPDCWADKAFLEDTLKRNPGMRIRLHVEPRIFVDGFASKDKIESNGARAGNRASGRTGDPSPTVVQGVEQSPAPPSLTHPSKIIPFKEVGRTDGRPSDGSGAAA